MDYIELGGRRLRVEVNWNAYGELLDFCGKTSFDDLAEVLGDFSPKGAMRLMAACINEGERMDGHDVRFSPQDIGAMVSRDGHEIPEFMRIYTSQSTPAVPEESKKKE